jgi:hypothetical protein
MAGPSAPSHPSQNLSEIVKCAAEAASHPSQRKGRDRGGVPLTFWCRPFDSQVMERIRRIGFVSG